ncbi:M50 family metallopeptidase [Parerythrobacter lacustris]|uniref:M50 family metallopeptidase n=1 Tax=Parerythrobacter lacustris TaxID=2969984 RepID=A0ABT1XRD3_9SPHN|nr:M50 family metallopeptidase [Parerythrobacter lacustris]MCR2834220.1 M50 family metallopeptidase [Parerythrobacter lacustris]
MRWLVRGLGYLVWLIANFALFGFAGSLGIFPNGFVALLAVLLLNFPAILIHELGHAWIAHLRGAHVLKIVALPFGYAPSERRLRIERHVPSRDIGGYVSYIFRRRDETRRDRVAIAVAGPLANLLSAALVIGLLSGWQATQPVEPTETALVVIVPGAPEQARPGRFPSNEEIRALLEKEGDRRRSETLQGTATGLAWLFAAISIILGLANLVPTKGSDGSVILRNLMPTRRKA